MAKMHGLSGMAAMSELSVKELIRNLSTAAKSVQGQPCNPLHSNAIAAENNFRDIASAENILALLAYVAELEAEKASLRPVGVMSQDRFHALENSQVRFIALWPRPGIYLPRKRPDDGVIVYARTAGIECEVV